MVFLNISDEIFVAGFKTVAHFFVGGLFTAWWMSTTDFKWNYLYLAIFVSLVELACFIWTH
jgi:hypothetical protein